MAITLKEIDGRLTQVKTLGRELNTFIHDTAMMIILHAAPKEASPDASGSGNCTRAVKLVRAMPASMRRKMLIAWFETFTPIRIKLSDQGDKCEYDPKYKKLDPAEKLGWWKLEEAAETSFADMSEDIAEGAEKVYDIAALVEMLTRVGKQIAKKKEDGKIAEADEEGANRLISIINSISVADLLKKAPVNDADRLNETNAA